MLFTLSAIFNTDKEQQMRQLSTRDVATTTLVPGNGNSRSWVRTDPIPQLAVICSLQLTHGTDGGWLDVFKSWPRDQAGVRGFVGQPVLAGVDMAVKRMESRLWGTVEQLLYCEITDFSFPEPSLRLREYDVKLLSGVDKAEVSHHLSLCGQLRVAFRHLHLEWLNFSPCCDQCLTKSV